MITPNQFQDGSDSDRIELAIAHAVETGARSVEIPRVNESAGGPLWRIDRAILLPSDFTLILRDCRVELAPRAQCNLIRNGGTEKQPIEQDRNIHVLGVGNAVLSGGFGKHFPMNGDMNGWEAIGVLFCNVKRFRMEGFQIEESHNWSISLENGCAHGHLANIDFHNTGRHFSEELGFCPNQDGINLRKGCHDIAIENITGVCTDEVVALTGLRGELRRKPRKPGAKPNQIGGYLPGPDDDIYNVTIQNVRASNAWGYGIVGVRAADGVRCYNIAVRDIFDVSRPGAKRCNAVLKIGTDRYFRAAPSQMGDIFNLHVDNVVSRGEMAIRLEAPLKDSSIQNVRGYDGCTAMLQKTDPGIACENVLFEGRPLA